MAPESNYTPPNDMPPAPIHRVLVGQKALITGASKGLGQGMAIGLAQAGADVLVNYNSDEEGARWTAEEIKKLGRKAVIFKADVAEEDQVQAMFRKFVEEFGRLDICIPNSALQLNAPVDQMTMGQWQRVINVNLTGVFLACREFVRLFKKQGINRSVSDTVES